MPSSFQLKVPNFKFYGIKTTTLNPILEEDTANAFLKQSQITSEQSSI